MGLVRYVQRSLTKRASQLAFDTRSRQFCRALSRDHENIHSRPQLDAPAAEKLPDLSFDPIANHCIPYLAADSDP